jgi:hypothetical protein
MAPRDAMPPSAPGSPSASQMLMSAEKHPSNSYLWVESKQGESDQDVWALVKVVRQENTLLTVLNTSTGQKMEIDLVRRSSHNLLRSCATLGCLVLRCANHCSMRCCCIYLSCLALSQQVSSQVDTCTCDCISAALHSARPCSM